MTATTGYPLRLEGHLDAHLSRWMWLVKWFLAIPHYIVLVFLWMSFAVLSVIAFFAILFTGRYPRSIFEFNVGVLRWSWRVSYYAYGVMGTDRYPPFTLSDDPDYPARLDVEYPEHLSRGLVLVKWWLLAIPHYLIVGILIGSGTWFARQGTEFYGMSLIGILALIAVLGLAFTGAYPRPLFDLILGLNRWVLRVAAYAGLMTDAYPPFRLDMGETESVGRLTVPFTETAEDREVVRRTSGWGPGSITMLAIGCLTALMAATTFVGGAGVLWAHSTQRDAQGFITTPATDLVTDGYALVATDVDVRMEDAAWLPQVIFDRARLSATAMDGSPIFIGVARSSDVDAYLAGTAYGLVEDVWQGSAISRSGAGVPAAPGEQTFWLASASGPGPQEIEWKVRSGEWSFVAMHPEVEKGVALSAEAGARVPILPWIAAGLFIAGGILLLFAAGLIIGSVAMSRRKG